MPESCEREAFEASRAAAGLRHSLQRDLEGLRVLQTLSERHHESSRSSSDQGEKRESEQLRMLKWYSEW